MGESCPSAEMQLVYSTYPADGQLMFSGQDIVTIINESSSRILQYNQIGFVFVTLWERQSRCIHLSNQRRFSN